MSYPINYPTPQRSNFQAFYGGGSTRDWVKPQGASMVRMLLIGAGGNGFGGTTANGGGGGGSGAITSWIGPAMFVPDVLQIQVGLAGGAISSTGASIVNFQQKSGTAYILLRANGGATGAAGSGGAAGAVFANNYFGASGIFKSIAGQAGTNTQTSITASTTTFLSGGTGGGGTGAQNGGTIASKYGYPAVSGGTAGGSGNGGKGNDGYFMLQPILIGQGGSGGGGGGGASGVGGNGGNGGIGCGGGGGGFCTSGTSTGGRGGDGAVFIWSW
jgi:hypothetical protein